MERLTKRISPEIIEFVDGKGYAQMNHQEGVKALFNCLAAYEDTNLTPSDIADLRSELQEYNDLAAEYGIDGKTMLALAKSQIATAKSNCELQEELDRYHESIYANLIRENMQMKECYQETIIQYKEEIDDLIKTLKCHSDCIWFGKRHQKCSCCRRNLSMKDNYEKR